VNKDKVLKKGKVLFKAIVNMIVEMMAWIGVFVRLASFPAKFGEEGVK